MKWSDFLKQYGSLLTPFKDDPTGAKAFVKSFCEAKKISLTDDEGKAVDFDTAELKIEVVEEEKKSADVDVEALVQKTVKAAREAEIKASGARGRVYQEPESKAFKVPATAIQYGAIKSFKDRAGMTAVEQAYRVGQWWLAIRGNDNAKRFCKEHGIEIKAGQTEGTNSTGGYLVPPEFDNAILDLRLQYGVFRRNARTRMMSRDTLAYSRRTGGLTAYFVGEQGNGTVSNKTWDQIQLVAKKLMVLTKFTNELREDAVISLGDDLASEIAWAFEQKIDQCGFLGDGTSTYGGILGIISSLAIINCTGITTAATGIATAASQTGCVGVYNCTGTTYAGPTLAEIVNGMGNLPTYARIGAKVYCSPTVWDAVFSRLALAAGGNTSANVTGGVPGFQFNGYPVELTEALPSVAATKQIFALFGNLQQAADFGDRRENTISISEDATLPGDSYSVFATDEVALRGTTRFDINNHDLGTSTTAGAVIGFELA